MTFTTNWSEFCHKIFSSSSVKCMCSLAIVMGNDNELTFKKLEDACILLGRGVEYIATNPDWVCPTWYGYVPDCGSVSQMLCNATKRMPKFIGKPEPDMALLAMEKTGVYKLKDKAPHHLSGGQKQRVAIAGIIAMRPDYIVLDEPTAMLDPEGRRDVMNAIKRLNRELGITVVYITHYMEEACEADRIVVMDDSRLLMDGTPKEVFSDTEKIRSIGLDVPQTCQLAKMLKLDGIKLKNDLLSIDELVENIDELLKGQ